MSDSQFMVVRGEGGGVEEARTGFGPTSFQPSTMFLVDSPRTWSWVCLGRVRTALDGIGGDEESLHLGRVAFRREDAHLEVFDFVAAAEKLQIPL